MSRVRVDSMPRLPRGERLSEKDAAYDLRVKHMRKERNKYQLEDQDLFNRYLIAELGLCIDSDTWKEAIEQTHVAMNWSDRSPK